MTRYFRVATCPYCSAKTDFSNTTQKQLLGSPIRTCRKCKHSYFDAAYKEDAIYYYETECTGPEPPQISINLLYTVLLGVALYGSINIALAGVSAAWIFVLAIGTVLYFLTRGTIHLIYGKNNPEKYCEEALRHLENDERFAMSLFRLSDREYLDFLKEMGAEVPEYFFKRIGNAPAEKKSVPQKEQQKTMKLDYGTYKGLESSKKNSTKIEDSASNGKQGDSTGTQEKAERAQFEDLLKAWLDAEKAEKLSKMQVDKTQRGAKDNQKETTGIQNQSIPNQLREFKALWDEGIITEEEFRRKKEQLLDL